MNTLQLSLSLSVRVRPPQASRYELGLYHDLSRFRLMSCLSFRLDLCHRVEDLNEFMQPCATTVCGSPPALLGKNTINTVLCRWLSIARAFGHPSTSTSRHECKPLLDSPQL